MDNSEQQEITLKLDVKEIKDSMNEKVTKIIENRLSFNQSKIEAQIDKFFEKKFALNQSNSDFENALDWALELLYRNAFENVIKTLNYQEMVEKKIQEVIKNDDFITRLAKQKVANSLGVKIEEDGKE